MSNKQITKELDLDSADVQQMTTQLREGVVKKKSKVTLQDKVEFDEVYIVAGHKGNPEAVAGKGRGRSSKSTKGRSRSSGTLEKEKPPIFGMIQRGGQVVI